MFEFWNFGIFVFLCILRKSNPKLNPQYVGHKFWNSTSRNDLDSATVNYDVNSCCWHWDVIVAFSGIAFDMTLFKCTWIIQLFWSILKMFWIQNVVNISLTFATENIWIVEIVGIYPSFAINNFHSSDWVVNTYLSWMSGSSDRLRTDLNHLYFVPVHAYLL